MATMSHIQSVQPGVVGDSALEQVCEKTAARIIAVVETQLLGEDAENITNRSSARAAA